MKTINTGTPRNVLGHVISGAIASAVISGAINYKKYQKFISIPILILPQNWLFFKSSKV